MTAYSLNSRCLSRFGFARLLLCIVCLPLTTVAAPEEKILRITYEIDCGDRENLKFPGVSGFLPIPAEIRNDGPTNEIRFHLFLGKHSSEISLPANIAAALAENPPQLQNSECELEKFETELLHLPNIGKARADWAAIALRYSPYMVLRQDQVDDVQNDLPLEMIYSVHHLGDGTSELRYTTFFSDEDSITSTSDNEGHMARYGRTTDIEWTYKVTFSRTGVPMSAEVQGNATDKAHADATDTSGDHAAVSVKLDNPDAFWPGTNHYICLYKEGQQYI